MTTKNDFHVHIAAHQNPFYIDWKELWHYRDLMILLAQRDFSLRYKQTILGPLWLIINPLVTSLIHAIVFNGIAKIGTDGVPSILFQIIGHGIWSFLSTMFFKCSDTFNHNAHMFGKVYFPRFCVPLSYMMVGMVELFIKLSIAFGLIAYYCAGGVLQVTPINWIWLPLITIWVGALAMGLGLIVSALTTKYRDLRHLVTFGVNLWMYGSPVVYPLSTLAASRYRLMVMANPASAPLELFRSLILNVGGVSTKAIIYSICFTIVVLFIGIVSFNKVEKTFMDTV